MNLKISLLSVTPPQLQKVHFWLEGKNYTSVRWEKLFSDPVKASLMAMLGKSDFQDSDAGIKNHHISATFHPSILKLSTFSENRKLKPWLLRKRIFSTRWSIINISFLEISDNLDSNAVVKKITIDFPPSWNFFGDLNEEAEPTVKDDFEKHQYWNHCSENSEYQYFGIGPNSISF